MKLFSKPVLLSALIYPGAGHFFLKKYYACAFLVITASAALYVLVSHAISQALLISDQILAGEIQPTPEAVRELIARQLEITNTPGIDIATVVIVVVWLIGIIDSYRLERKRNQMINNTKVAQD